MFERVLIALKVYPVIESRFFDAGTFIGFLRDSSSRLFYLNFFLHFPVFVFALVHSDLAHLVENLSSPCGSIVKKVDQNKRLDPLYRAWYAMARNTVYTHNIKCKMLNILHTIYNIPIYIEYIKLMFVAR